MKFSRPEYWSALPFPSPRDLPNPGIELWSLTLQEDSLPAEPPGKKEVDHCRLVGGRFKKQENLLTRLVLGDCTITDLHTLPARILKFIQRTELGSVMYTVQVVSAPQDCLTVLSLGSFWHEEGKQNTHSKDG